MTSILMRDTQGKKEGIMGERGREWSYKPSNTWKCYTLKNKGGHLPWNLQAEHDPDFDFGLLVSLTMRINFVLSHQVVICYSSPRKWIYVLIVTINFYFSENYWGQAHFHWPFGMAFLQIDTSNMFPVFQIFFLSILVNAVKMQTWTVCHML